MASKFLERNFASMNKKEEETPFEKAMKKFKKQASSIKGSISDKEYSIFKKLLEEE